MNDLELIRSDIMNMIDNYEFSKNTLWKKIQRLRKFFNFCVENNFISYNPISKYAIPEYTNKEPAPVSQADFETTINAISYMPLKNALKFVYLTGVRAHEIIKISKEDISEDFIQIRSDKVNTRWFPIDIAPGLRELIAELIADNKNPLLGFNSPDTLRNRINRTLEALRLPKFSLQNLRQSAINNNLHLPLEFRSMIFGHSIPVQYKNYISNPTIEIFAEKYKNLK